jgi:CubicO group peptidase (beta-lactamase class C family)
MMRDGRIRSVAALLSILSLCLVPGCGDRSSSPDPAPDELVDAVVRQLAEWLPEGLTKRGVPGAAAAVVGRDAVVREQVYGVTGPPGSPAVTPDTLFCIRSISKSVTALAVLMAVQDGLLDLDTPISRYLPEFTIRSRFDERPGDLITLRQMLSHWAGFTHDPPPRIDLTRPDYFRQYIEKISDTWLRFPVGYRHQYANYGPDLAGYIIEVRSGVPFADFVRERVLEPIGMTRSTFDLEIAEQADNRALGHDTRGKVVPLPFPEIPAAGLFSTLRDMTRYVQFHLNGGIVDGRRLLREDFVRQYHSVQFADADQRNGYSLGLFREVVGDSFCLYHEGGGAGFGSLMVVYPELGFGAVILTNREYHGMTGAEGRAVIHRPVRERYGAVPVADPGTESMREIDADDPRLKTIAGRYGDSSEYVIGFVEGVPGRHMEQKRFTPMTFFDDGGAMVGIYGRAELRFLPPYGGRPGAMWLGGVRYLDFNDSPLDPPGPGRPEWQSYVGEYEVLWAGEPFTTISIETRNGYLYYNDGKCEEHEPGLFFRYDGETLDFRSTPPTFANLELRRKP